MDTLSVMKAEDSADSVANTVAVVMSSIFCLGQARLAGRGVGCWVTKFCYFGFKPKLNLKLKLSSSDVILPVKYDFGFFTDKL